MIATEPLVGLPICLLAVAAGAVLLRTRNGIASRIGRSSPAADGSMSLVASVIFLIGFCLVFLGSGVALFIGVRAAGGLSH